MSISGLNFELACALRNTLGLIPYFTIYLLFCPNIDTIFKLLLLKTDKDRQSMGVSQEGRVNIVNDHELRRWQVWEAPCMLIMLVSSCF